MTREQAALQIVMALGEAIQSLKSVPSGHLYAQVMGQVSLEAFNGAIGVLKRAGAVKEENHLLTWVGPA